MAVYDTGEAETDAGPLPYIVMEYVDGDTLRDIVRRFDGTLCLNASVVTPARVAVGDSVELL